MTILDVLDRNVALYGNETALVERSPAEGTRRELTWAEFGRQANRVANALVRRGIGPGDRVTLLLMNCLEWLPIYFGVLRSGALAVPLNFRFSAPEIGACLETSGSRALLYGPEFAPRVAALGDQLGGVETVVCVGGEAPAGAVPFAEFLAAAGAAAPGIPVAPQDAAALYFTSGTTGQPKPILLTHANLYGACVCEQAHHGQTHADNFICIPPLYHTGAKMHWFGNFLVGAPAVILRGVKPEWILEAVSAEGGTVVWLLVPWAQDILDALDSGALRLEDYRLAQWRLMHIGAQPVPPALVERWLARFPWQQYDTNYGLSEATGPGCVHLGVDNVHKVGAIGMPGHGWQTRIVGPNGAEVASGTVGELAVRGPGVMQEYYGNPTATAEVLRDGWLFTGDMARQDDEGFLYLVDRKKDLIIVGGENVFPVEIEDFLRRHPAVRDAAAIGLPDARLGEIPAAVVELKAGATATPEEIHVYCQGLARYKRPRQVFLDAVPRNPTGKIEKPKLRQKYSSRLGGDGAGPAAGARVHPEADGRHTTAGQTASPCQ